MKRLRTGYALTVAAVLSVAACDRAPADYEVVATYPHDVTAYTQGLLTSGGVLFESTGRYGLSDVRRVDLETGTVLQRHRMSPTQFGEGLAIHGDRLYQLTWKEGTAWVYSAETLAPLDSFRYQGEGWGLASDGHRLYMSDGSDSIRVLVPETFTLERVLHVRHLGAPLTQLNELEVFDGTLLANIYHSNRVAQIETEGGEVLRLLDFRDLYPERPPRTDVMNGIAVTPDGTQLLLTGKFWPILFQVRLLPAARP